MPDQTFAFNTVMLVDDSEIDILVNKRLMELTKFARQFFVFSSAESALEYLKTECSKPEHFPDLIFLDMNLPGLSGNDFIDAFEKINASLRQRSKIIILSVLHRADWVERAKEKDFILCELEKPLTLDKVKELAGLASKQINVSF